MQEASFKAYGLRRRLFQKRAISDVWTHLPSSSVVDGSEVLLGDDAAAIKTGDGYLLLAGEGVYPPLVAENPYLAGRTSVLTNISDIYAMGGRPVAVVDVVFSNSTENAFSGDTARDQGQRGALRRSP
ncbi:MAG: AIR synthase related protein [Thermodesulfobacteriota bacterium]